MTNKELQVKLNELINLVNGLKNDGHITEKQRRSLNSCIKSAYFFKAHRDSFLKCIQRQRMSEVRLIDANALEKTAIPCEIHNGALTELCVPLYQIRNATTVPNEYMRGYEAAEREYKRPTGKWIDDKCSVCNKGIEDLISSPEWYKDETPNYCPFCGVRIEEEEK